MAFLVLYILKMQQKHSTLQKTFFFFAFCGNRVMSQEAVCV